MNAQTIRKFRKTLKMTQKEFGESIGVTQYTVSSYEKTGQIPSTKEQRILELMEQAGFKEDEPFQAEVSNIEIPVEQPASKDLTAFIIENYKDLQQNPLFQDLVKAKAFELIVKLNHKR